MGFMQKYWAVHSYNICFKTKTKNDILIGFVNNKHEHFTVIDAHFNGSFPPTEMETDPCMEFP